MCTEKERTVYSVSREGVGWGRRRRRRRRAASRSRSERGRRRVLVRLHLVLVLMHVLYSTHEMKTKCKRRPRQDIWGRRM